MIVSLYAGIAGLMLIFLSINVIKGRRIGKVALGDGGQFDMVRRMRAHGNFVEYTPMFLILLALAESNKLPDYAIHFFGVLFLAGRFMHGLSVLKIEQYEGEKLMTNPKWRIRGMICTFASLGLLATIVVMQFMISALIHISIIAD